MSNNEITIGKEILYLTYQDIVNIGLNDDEILNLVELSLAEHGKKNCEMPAKIGLHPKKDTLMHAMPAFIPKFKTCGIKWGACFPENYKHSLPQTSALFILNDPNTGWPLAIMDAIWITAKRTAAVTAVACKYLARQDSQQLGIIGAGVQGREHIKVLQKRLPNLKRVNVYDIRTDVLDAFVKEFNTLFECEVSAVSGYRETIEDSDIVVSATAILQEPNPQIRDYWIKDGVFIAPIDFDSLWEFKTMSRMDKFLVDSLEEMVYFESIGYLPNGLPKVYAELGEVVCGAKVGREYDGENIMDVNIGMAVEDVPVACELYKRAIQLGIGTRLPL